jgi:DNA-binding LacI/PurR family transcriptional regulator/nitrogen-specific signal transduction histidine kinase
MGAPKGERARAGRIGVVSLFASDDAYERGVIAGIADVVGLRGVSLVCFAIEGVRDEFDEFVGRENVDGLVVLSGSIAQVVGRKAVESFCERRRPLPMVSMAMGLAGVPTIRVDNAKGVRDSVGHLVTVHGRRRIGFIHGPEQSADGEERFLAYREALAEHGIEFDPAWAAPHLNVDQGGEAIRILIDERKQAVDALVAVDDSLALGALNALLERGLSVPQDVALVGFDDIAEASAVIPPLTTVTQKLWEQGRKAAELLLDVIEGKDAPEQLLLDTELVVRGSCGCLPRAVLEARAGRGRTAVPPERFDAVRTEIEQKMASILGDDLGRPGTRLLDAFSADLADGTSRSFLSALDLLLNRVARVGGDLSRWEQAISAMRRISLPTLAANEPLRSVAEDLWQEARVLIGDTAQRAQAFQRVVALQRASSLGAISQSLITTRDIEELIDVLSDGLPRLEVKSCYVSLYESRESRQWSTLVLGVQENGQVAAQVGTRFATHQLVPEGIFTSDRSHRIVVMPLSFKNEQLGVIILEVYPGSAGAYDELRKQFGAAVKRLEGERELARLHALQRERTEELERAYQAVRENQQKLLISEKMASLGRLTAGMAHEMNTPLAAVRAALGELAKLASEYHHSIDDPEVTEDDHREIVKEMEASIRLADGAAERVAGFVRGIKSETRNLASVESRLFNAVPVVQDTLLLLNHAARKGNCAVTFQHERDIMELFGAPGRLSQVVTNLVTNAIDATAEKGGGPIILRLAPWIDGLELRVTDTGMGIPPENVKKIFDPMFTSKPFGVGTGLGLTIVHDIVTGDFNGTIEVESEPGVGTTFVLCFANREA